MRSPKQAESDWTNVKATHLQCVESVSKVNSYGDDTEVARYCEMIMMLHEKMRGYIRRDCGTATEEVKRYDEEDLNLLLKMESSLDEAMKRASPLM